MLSILIPSRLEPNILKIIQEIECVGPDEIVIYNDRYGQGKGFAIREALNESKGDKIIYIDGDGDINTYQLHLIIAGLRWFDVVVGKKSLPVRLDRKLLTFLSRLWIRLLFGLKVDTQTGIKGFNYRPEWKTNLWAFDTEILYNAKKQGKTMTEILVDATVSDNKTLRDILSTLKDTLKIRMNLC
jgi:glycosyltransferase involved in cell wall biosynthesis